MTGEVVGMNPARGMAGVLTEDGSYSILELLDDGVQLGDTLRWPGSTPSGHVRIFNVTQASAIDVCFQNHFVTKANLRRHLLL